MTLSNNSSLVARQTAQQISQAQTMLTRSLSRLSSGNRILNPGDDTTAVATADKLSAQNQRTQAAGTNVQNAISFVQTMDGFMGNIGKILDRMGELATNATDVTKNPSDISQYQDEFSTLQDQLRSVIGGDTSVIGGTQSVPAPMGSFNGTTLFDANAANTTVTIGKDAGQTMQINGVNFQQGSLLSLIHQDASGNYDLSVTSANALTSINGASDQTATARASVAGMESRLDIAATQLSVESQNLTSAISGIQDVDVASESTNLAKYNILVQAGTAMLSQANQTPEAVLKLLKN